MLSVVTRKKEACLADVEEEHTLSPLEIHCWVMNQATPRQTFPPGRQVQFLVPLDSTDAVKVHQPPLSPSCPGKGVLSILPLSA